MRISFLGLFLAFVFSQNVAAQTSRTFQLRTSQDVMMAHIEITGGEEAWKAIQAMRWEADMSTILDTVQLFGKRITVSQYPGYRYTEQTVMNGQIEQKWKVVYTPTEAWMQTPDGKEVMPLENNPSFQGAKEEITILADPDYQIDPYEKGIWEYKQVYIVTIRHQGETYKRFYNRSTLMLMRVETTKPDGSVYIISYSDYRAVGKVLAPFRIEVQPPNMSKQVFSLNSMELNPEVDAKLFVTSN